jgi:leucyl aminopeptidase
MAAKTDKNFWGFTRESLLVRALGDKPGKRHAQVHVHMGKKADVPKGWASAFQDSAKSATAAVRVSDAGEGVKILISPLAPAETETDARLKPVPEVRLREAMGGLIATLERLEVETAEIDFHVGADELDFAITGLEIALYRYKRIRKGEAPSFTLTLKQKGKALSAKTVGERTHLGVAVNLARHLVNLPPNDLNPVTYAHFCEEFFKGIKSVDVEVWDEKRLHSEKMNLHLAVGQGSKTAPRMVRVSYRPVGGKKAPIAFVGKGITFDSGGLDIKPSSGMRLMKKDMGGSASVLGLAYWAACEGVKQPLDFYLALAENSISGDAFRPGDVFTARNGLSVEIHNTDAEGRLVLADVLDVAVTADEKPRVVIDLATLTGAIKVALGSGLAGLFSNDQKLEETLTAAGEESGDLAWPMPLFQRYRSSTSSNFADMVNAVDGFGGAVTAALFLEKFVKDVPWAHFDIYAWKDSADGCMLESGGNGQTIQALAQWLGAQK